MDTDSIIDSFLEQCHLAGPEKCPLYSPSLDSVRATYFETLQQLKDSPLAVPAHGHFGPEMITHEDVYEIIVQAVYSPLKGFSRVARIINDLAHGNGTELAEFKQSQIPAACRSPLCERHPWSNACHNRNYVSVHNAERKCHA